MLPTVPTSEYRDAVTQTGVVTPEGVLLDYRPAGLATRTMGRLIDLSLQAMIVYFALTALLITLVTGAETLFVVLAIIMGFLLLFGYPVAFEVFGGGRTPGHRATGTRVIRTDGGPVRFRHAAIRAMLFLVDGVVTTGFAGAVSVLVTKRGQRLGDLAAGTMVVRQDSVSATGSATHIVSASLAERAVGFDRRRLRADDLTTARLLFDRGAAMRPGAQLDLATRLVERLDAQLGGVRLPEDSVGDFLAVIVSPPEIDPEREPEIDAGDLAPSDADEGDSDASFPERDAAEPQASERPVFEPGVSEALRSEPDVSEAGVSGGGVLEPGAAELRAEGEESSTDVGPRIDDVVGDDEPDDAGFVAPN